MDDREIMDKLRKSGQQEEIPDSLKPEMMMKRLAGEEQQKTGRFHFRRIYPAAAAAAAVVLLLGAGLWQKAQVKESGEQTIAKRETSHETAGMSKEETVSEEVELAEDTVPVAESYEELYEWFQNQPLVVYDTGMELAMEETMAVSDSAAVNSGGKGMAAGVSSEYSATNTREEAVDEGDVVKTDGTYLYILDKTKGISIVDGETLEKVGVLPLEDSYETLEEFYVDGDLLQVIVTARETRMEEGTSEEEQWDTVYYVDSRKLTRVYSYDISDRTKPEQTGAYEQDGTYETSRRNDGYLYLFTSYWPGNSMAKEDAATYIPEAGGGLIPCNDIYLPFQECSAGGSHYLVMSSIADGKPDKAVTRKALAADTGLFYVSENHIYLSSSLWGERGDETQIAAFSYEDGRIQGSGAGKVPGTIEDSFSMDEYKGYLRIVTSRWGLSEGGNADGGVSQRTNGIYVLDAGMRIVGKVEGLARNEEIKAARFMGETAYFVTYENTDPLFSADLSDPEKPEILGELKVTGFSDYLHVYGENRLLGIGWETDPDTGERLGLKLSMFDISDPSQVKELHRTVLKNVGDCPGMWNYKGILASPQKNLIGFEFMESSGTGLYAVFSYEEGKGFQKCLTEGLGSYSQELGEYGQIRGLYSGEWFYIAGSGGVRRYTLGETIQKAGELAL